MNTTTKETDQQPPCGSSTALSISAGSDIENNAIDEAPKNEEEAQAEPPMNKPSKSATTQAFVGTLQVMAACVGVFLAVIAIPDFFTMQKTYWSELSDAFIKVAQYNNCTEIYECIPEADVWCVANCPAIQENYVKFIVHAFPSTISQSISVTEELTGVIVNGFLTMAALLFMNSQMGMASIFPVEAGKAASIFHFFRWFFPFVTMYLVPLTPMFHDDSENYEVWGELRYGLLGYTGKGMQHTFFHGLYAILGFFFAPLLELIHVGLSVRRFSDLYQPLLVINNSSWNRFPSGFQNLYKYSWFLFQLCRTVAAIMTLVSLFYFFVRGGNYNDPYYRVKSIGHEMMLGLYLTVNYMFLSLTKILETGEGKLSTLIVLLPALAITLWMTVFAIEEDIKLANVDDEPLAFLGEHIAHMGCNIANFGGDFVNWIPFTESCVLPSSDVVSAFAAPSALDSHGP